MATPNGCIDRLFRDARTDNASLDKPVGDETLCELYNALKWGPTSANAWLARFVFIRTAKSKERLRPSLAPGNMEKTAARRNSSLQGAYLILAARALGLDCGPMSGFDNAKLDDEFFGAGKECEGCEQEFLTDVASKTHREIYLSNTPSW